MPKNGLMGLFIDAQSMHSTTVQELSQFAKNRVNLIIKEA